MHVKFLLSLTRDRRARLVFQAALAIAFLAYALREAYFVIENLSAGYIWGNDFFTIWSFAKFALNKPVAEIYDNSVLHEFQMDLGAHPSQPLPFAHPPSFIFVILPLGWLSYGMAYAAWGFGTLLCYLIASWYKQLRLIAAFLAIFAPATTIMFIFGQTGFLSAAFIVGGFRLTACRPILSGVLFGLASIKPQLGILVPIALVSARRWRTFAAAGGTVCVLVLTSSMAFGWSIWPLWLAKLSSHADWVVEVKDRYNPTIIASLTSFGIDLAAARTVQLCAAVVVAVIIWICFRGGVTMLAAAALLVGTFLATPYAFVYDLPMLTNAVVIVLVEKARTESRLTVPETFILVWSLVLPIIMLETWRLALIRTVPLVLLFGLIVWLIFRRDMSQSDPVSTEIAAGA